LRDGEGARDSGFWAEQERVGTWDRLDRAVTAQVTEATHR
jgi:hypothetical protein